MEKSMLRKVEELFLFFLATSIIGWMYEVFLEVVVYRWGYSDRGVLIGPYCIVYGVGAIVLLLCLGKFMKKKIRIGKVNITPVLVFIGIMVIATAIELIASYIMEWTTGDWMWDYDRFWLNFEGRIAPNPSFRFGIGGMVMLYIFYPLFRKIIDNRKVPQCHHCHRDHGRSLSAGLHFSQSDLTEAPFYPRIHNLILRRENRLDFDAEGE